METTVGVVVVTFNRLQLLKEVIASLRDQTYSNYKIIVVNNGSTDGTATWLSSQTDIYTITQENVGGAGGFFSGIKYVSEHGFDYCWVMDDDVVCQPMALKELIDAFRVKPDIGFVCSKVVGIDGCPMNVPSIDIRPTSNGYPDYFEFIAQQMLKVSMATFVSVLFATKVVRELGLPYKEFFIWGDDSEYTSRISKTYDCYLACKSIVVHKRSIQGSLSFFTEKDPKRLNNYFYMFRNNDFVYLKNASLKKKVMWCLRRLVFLIKLLFKGDFVRFHVLIKATLALWHFNPDVVFPKS